MCGICGEYAFNAPPVQPDVITAMRDTLTHRGPDDAGLFVDGPVGLGHRRLSIIDLSPLGHQPMASADGNVHIVFNGEVYNHMALRQDLAREGVVFRGGSDTETIVNAVAVFGLEAALERFQGMFALALWDARDRSLTLCRDRVGVKPLYYLLDDKRLLFASELRGLLAHPDVVPTLDRPNLAGHLVDGFFAGTGTVLAGVRKLAPGTWLRVAADGTTTSRRYWDLGTVRRGSFPGTFDEALEEARALFRDAFGLRLVADVPVGHFLSGGVDSSLVAAVLRTDLGVSLDTFTIGFGENAFDESTSATEVAERLHLPNAAYRLDQEEAWQELENFCEIYDEPFGDPSGIPTAILSRFTASQVKVALSADGGDEQFCGYTGYVRYPALWRRGRALPAPVRALCTGGLHAAGRLLRGRLGSAFASGRKPHLAALLDKLTALLNAPTPALMGDLYRRKGFTPQEADALLGLRAPSASARAAGDDDADLTDALMRRDFATWLPEDILLKVDRASMHASLESRDPFLDHRIAEWAFSLPLPYLTQNGVQKRLLRTLLTGYLGPKAGNGPKRGFDIPLYRWLMGPWRPMVEQALSPASVRDIGILDPQGTAAEMARFYGGQGGDPVRIWLLYNVQTWAQRWYVSHR